MTPNGQAKLKRSLVLHEKRSNFLYNDTLGNPTIGIGYNIGARGLSDEWIDKQYAEDVLYFYSQLQEFQWFAELNEDRQVVLLDMAFMGLKKFLGFTLMIEALKNKDYETAAIEMLNSEWAKEVKGRAITLSNAMRSGVYDV